MSECNHSWRAIPGTNDYECDSCGDRKLDSGALVSEWQPASLRCDDIEPHDPHGDCDGLALVAGDALLDRIVNGPTTTPSPLLAASAERLAAAIAPRAFAHEFRREVRVAHGVPMGVAMAQDDALEIANRILASGAVRDVATLADDEALVETIAGRPSGRLVVQHILRALAAALEDR